MTRKPGAAPVDRPRIAIVGCGRIAGVHAGNLSRDARLAFTSRNPESARAFAARFSGEPLAGFDEALERKDIAAVAICSPLEHHGAQAVAALEAGKTVLVEKPLAQSPGEVEAIGRALAGRPPGSLMVAENYLYKPSLDVLRAWLPAIGPLRRVRISKLTRQEPADWRTRHGALLEGGIHFVALLGALIGETPSSVKAAFPGATEPERSSLVELEYPSGARGEVRYAWNVRSLPGGILQHSRIEGAHGRIVFESNGLYAGVVGYQGRRGLRLRLGPGTDLLGFRAMAQDFLRSVQDPERRPRSDFETARRDLEIVFRAYDTR